MSTLTELGAYLVTKSIGTLGTTMFLGPLPMGVTAGVAVQMVTGGRVVRAMGPVLGAPVADTPSFQVVVRNPDHTAGETKVKAVIDALDHYWGTLSGTSYLYMELEYGPIYLGLDENNRHRWSTVFRATKRRS